MEWYRFTSNKANVRGNLPARAVRATLALHDANSYEAIS
jgi:hypothetical protein